MFENAYGLNNNEPGLIILVLYVYRAKTTTKNIKIQSIQNYITELIRN